MEEVKAAFKSRSLAVGMVTTVTGLLALPGVVAVVPLEALPYVTVTSGVLSILLRFLTKGPISLRS